MSLKISPLDRYDAIDREQFRSMIDSDSFASFKARLTVELERAISTCTHAENQLELLRAQGAVAALRSALATPDRILDEMNTGRK